MNIKSTIKKLVYVLPVMALVAFGLVVGVRAQSSTNTGNSVLVSSDTQITSDYFAGGGNVKFSGTANSDAYIAGGQVTVSGTVKGDLLVAGGNVTVDGNVEGDIRAAGGQVYINGKVGKNITVTGGNVTIAKSAVVGGNVVAGGGMIDLSGQVGGDVRVGSGALSLSGQVGGDLEAAVDTLAIASSAKVGGELTYISENDAVVASGAVLNGITKKLPPKETGIKASYWGARLAGMLMTIFTAVILAWLLPGSLKRGANKLRQRPGIALGLGFVSVILVPIVAVMAMLSVIGLPLGVLGLIGYFVSLYVAMFFVITWAGEQITTLFKLKTSFVLTVFIGAVFYALLGMLPGIGEVITLAGTLFGMGVIVQKANSVLNINKKTNAKTA